MTGNAIKRITGFSGCCDSRPPRNEEEERADAFTRLSEQNRIPTVKKKGVFHKRRSVSRENIRF